MSSPYVRNLLSSGSVETDVGYRCFSCIDDGCATEYQRERRTTKVLRREKDVGGTVVVLCNHDGGAAQKMVDVRLSLFVCAHCEFDAAPPAPYSHLELQTRNASLYSTSVV